NQVGAEPAPEAGAARGPSPCGRGVDDVARERGERALERRESSLRLADVVEQRRRRPARALPVDGPGEPPPPAAAAPPPGRVGAVERRLPAPQGELGRRQSRAREFPIRRFLGRAPRSGHGAPEELRKRGPGQRPDAAAGHAEYALRESSMAATMSFPNRS